MREKMQRFMYGRYGFDELSRITLAVSIACMVVSVFVRGPLFYLLGIAAIVYTYYRAFSRDITRRQSENQKFRNMRYQLAIKKSEKVRHQEQKKIYRFYKCPSCKQKVRVPKGRGKICITCPKCKMEFVKKS